MNKINEPVHISEILPSVMRRKKRRKERAERRAKRRCHESDSSSRSTELSRAGSGGVNQRVPMMKNGLYREKWSF